MLNLILGIIEAFLRSHCAYSFIMRKMKQESISKKWKFDRGRLTGVQKVHLLDATLYPDITRKITSLREVSESPILVLCEKHQMAELIDYGADDCIERHCEQSEFEARMSALERRSKRMKFKNTRIKSGNIVINIAKSVVKISDTVISLAPSEYRIFMYLMLHKGELLSKQKVCMRTIKENAWSSSHLINMHMYNLRKKLGKMVSIVTVPRRGFLVEL